LPRQLSGPAVAAVKSRWLSDYAKAILYKVPLAFKGPNYSGLFLDLIWF
jgi:hypothetical protein